MWLSGSRKPLKTCHMVITSQKDYWASTWKCLLVLLAHKWQSSHGQNVVSEYYISFNKLLGIWKIWNDLLRGDQTTKGSFNYIRNKVLKSFKEFKLLLGQCLIRPFGESTRKINENFDTIEPLKAVDRPVWRRYKHFFQMPDTSFSYNYEQLWMVPLYQNICLLGLQCIAMRRCQNCSCSGCSTLELDSIISDLHSKCVWS